MATILLVEDERNVGHLLRSILEEAGHGVIEACDGAVALAKYRSYRTDFILADLMMPKEDGLRFIAEVQRECPHARIAAMTGGDGTLAPADEARMSGVSSILRKSLDLEELLQVIQGELNAAVQPA
jgi:two-component system, chemotaxis family, chemotaxis protein CheY